MTLVHDHDDIDWPGLTWSLPARVLGTGIGVWVVAVFTDRQLGIAVGVMVLIAMVLITWRVFEVPVNRGTLSAAGFVGGITGTATSIGGPPFALLYQHRPAQQIRTTMAVYFLIGAALSLVGLVIAGDLTGAQLRAALELFPALAARRRRSAPVAPAPAGRSGPAGACSSSARPPPWCCWSARCSDER